MSKLKTPSQRKRTRRTSNAPPAPVHDLDGMLRRLHLPTVRRLYAELATRAEADGMSYHTYLETLIAEEIAHRAETRLTRAVHKARFPFLRTIERGTTPRRRGAGRVLSSLARSQRRRWHNPGAF